MKKDKKPKTVIMSSKQVRIAAVLFVPQTPNGELAKLLRNKMDEMAPGLGWKFKVV